MKTKLTVEQLQEIDSILDAMYFPSKPEIRFAFVPLIERFMGEIAAYERGRLAGQVNNQVLSEVFSKDDLKLIVNTVKQGKGLEYSTKYIDQCDEIIDKLEELINE